MDLFEKVKKNVTQISYYAADKAKKTTEILKVKEKIRQEKKEIREITYKIGKTYINLHEHDYEKEYEKYFIALEKVKENLKKSEAALQKLNEKIRCPECGAEMSPMDEYCSECGTAAAFDTELKEEQIIDSPDEKEYVDEE